MKSRFLTISSAVVREAHLHIAVRSWQDYRWCSASRDYVLMQTYLKLSLFTPLNIFGKSICRSRNNPHAYCCTSWMPLLGLTVDIYIAMAKAWLQLYQHTIEFDLFYLWTGHGSDSQRPGFSSAFAGGELGRGCFDTLIASWAVTGQRPRRGRWPMLSHIWRIFSFPTFLIKFCKIQLISAKFCKILLSSTSGRRRWKFLMCVKVLVTDPYGATVLHIPQI